MKIYPFKKKPRFGYNTESDFNRYYYYKTKKNLNAKKNQYGKNLTKFLNKF